MYDITKKTVGPANFKSLGKELKLEVQLGNAMPNELLQVLTQRGQVTHFVEKIPSVNDIFIQTVSESKYFLLLYRFLNLKSKMVNSNPKFK
jgi:ABC-2 type transport system ATP-binding protein